MKIPTIHIGNEIKKHLEQQGMKMTHLGDKINTSRQNVSRLLNSESINTDMLKRISEALNYNFFKAYSADEPPLFDDKSKTKLVLEINVNNEDLKNFNLKNKILEYFNN